MSEDEGEERDDDGLAYVATEVAAQGGCCLLQAAVSVIAIVIIPIAIWFG